MSRKMKHNEKLAFKYKFLREKIIESYRKGCKILDIVKGIFAAVFMIFSIIAVNACQHNQDKTVWLSCWVILIFIDVGIFLITDYCKYLVKTKVIPYLEDDDRLEFGEYEIFMDDDDEEDDDEDEEEED